jgi:glutaredoxin
MKIKVYSLPDCPKCDKLKAYLEKEGIEFDSKWFDTEAQTNFIMLNMFGNPPVLTVEDRVEPSEKLFEGEELNEEFVMEIVR